MDTTATYAKLSQAYLAHPRRRSLLCHQPGFHFPPPPAARPWALSGLIAAIQTSSGVDPIIAGKPYTPMMNLVLEKLNLAPEEILAVGDRLNTDIQAGKNIGCKTALVLTGISTRAEAEALDSPPDIIAADFAALNWIIKWQQTRLQNAQFP